MDKRKKLLIIGIVMNCGGTEKSFLSFAGCLDFREWDVTLLLAKRQGELIAQIPPEINVITLPDPEHADMFLLSKQNAAKTIWKCFGRKNPLVLFEILPYFIKIIFNPKKRADYATRMWCMLLHRFARLEDEYDVAAAYWGDRTMFYMVECVNAKKKIAWLHFDYGNPTRDDLLYGSYFSRCDSVVAVSAEINAQLNQKFPALADKFITIENINNPKFIQSLALQGQSYPDTKYRGLRILTIARICHQKGIDLIIEALVKLRAEEFEFRWYVLGGGEEEEVNQMKAKAVECGVADMLILLGTTVNPYPYLLMCDIYVQASRYEGKPITVEEAKMLCRPIVATNYVSAAEQLEGGELGIIVDIDADSIYRGVARMLSDADLRQSFKNKLMERDFGNKSEINKFYQIAGEG